MSSLLSTAAAPTAVATRTEVVYTICSVYVASHVALQLGWLDEELARVGAKLTYLRSLPDARDHLAHFSHRLGNLVRDGGLVPPIWAHADITRTKLVGLTSYYGGGQIVVRTDSPFRTVADLRNHRVGLPKSLNPGKVDWWRANSERSLLLALRLAGLARSDVQFVDIEHDDAPAPLGRSQSPADNLARLSRAGTTGFTPEIPVLEAGGVDAIFTNFGLATRLERTGKFRVIEDLSRLPDWTLQSANSPYALTVDAQFAERHPEIVVAWLRASIRAGRWINAHREAAATLLHKVTYLPTPDDTARAIAGVDFVPNLAPQNLAAVTLEKRFLLEHGYLQRDFDLTDWADRSFLDEALGSL
jgi:ABC-type nitrate/sulfonate/bicarbonate transport system substrate-binding protein